MRARSFIDTQKQDMYNVCMATKTFNLSFPADLLKILDSRAKSEFSSRSEYIKKAVINQLAAEKALTLVLDKANKKGKRSGIKSEEQVYKIISE